MKNLLFTFFFLTIFSFTFAQELKVPKDYTLKTKDDFNKYQNQAIECMNWLDNNKFDEYVDIRKEAYKFVLIWIITNQNFELIYLSVINDDILSDKQPFIDELLMAYYVGMAKFTISNPKKENIKYQIAGIDNLLKVADNNSHLNFKSKVVIKYTKMKNSNQLETWLNYEMEKIDNENIEHSQSKNLESLDLWFMK